MEFCLILEFHPLSWKNPTRGFSFQEDGPLDMRMDQSMIGTAADLVNRWPEAQLADAIFQFGEERFSDELRVPLSVRGSAIPWRRRKSWSR